MVTIDDVLIVYLLDHAVSVVTKIVQRIAPKVTLFNLSHDTTDVIERIVVVQGFMVLLRVTTCFIIVIEKTTLASVASYLLPLLLLETKLLEGNAVYCRDRRRRVGIVLTCTVLIVETFLIACHFDQIYVLIG